MSLSSRADYERIRDAMISEGLAVEETSQLHDGGTLWTSRYWRRGKPAPEEAHYLLAVALRTGASFSLYPTGSVDLCVQLREPAEGGAA